MKWQTQKVHDGKFSGLFKKIVEKQKNKLWNKKITTKITLLSLSVFFNKKLIANKLLNKKEQSE